MNMVKFHCDQHCIKMILESTQLLWTAWHVTGQIPTNLNVKVYKQTHTNHPMAIWARSSKENYKFLVKFAINLAKEYDRRYRCKCRIKQYACKKCPRKTHACMDGLMWLERNVPRCDSRNEYKADQVFATTKLPESCTKVPLCMPEQYHSRNLVKAYRDYYRNDKGFAKSKYRTPEWYN